MPSRPSPVALWLAFVAGFVALAVCASLFDRFPADVWLSRQLQDVNSEAFADLLRHYANTVELPAVLVISIGAAIALLWRVGLTEAALIGLAAAGRAVNSGVKELVERPRPSEDLVRIVSQPSDSSFPSGHAAAAFLLYGVLFYLAALYVRPLAARLAVQAGCAALAILTGLERIYTGAHWPSDVLGAYYLGALLLALLVALHRSLHGSNRHDRTTLLG